MGVGTVRVEATGHHAATSSCRTTLLRSRTGWQKREGVEEGRWRQRRWLVAVAVVVVVAESGNKTHSSGRKRQQQQRVLEAYGCVYHWVVVLNAAAVGCSLHSAPLSALDAGTLPPVPYYLKKFLDRHFLF